MKRTFTLFALLAMMSANVCNLHAATVKGLVAEWTEWYEKEWNIIQGQGTIIINMDDIKQFDASTYEMVFYDDTELYSQCGKYALGAVKFMSGDEVMLELPYVNSKSSSVWYGLCLRCDGGKYRLSYPQGKYEAGVQAEIARNMEASQDEMEAFLGYYQSQGKLVNFENPTGLSEIKKDIQAPIFDLLGRQLKSAPQKGIYIQNGKKVLVK